MTKRSNNIHEDALTPKIVKAATSLAQTGSPEQNDEGVEAVMILVSRRIKSGAQETFKARLIELQQLLEQQSGFREMKAYEPNNPEEEYKVMIQFANAHDLANWQDSPQRKAWTQSVKELEAEAPRAQILTNTEEFEAIPEQEGMHQPAKHKTALMTWLGIFPLATIANWLLAPYLDSYSLWIKSAVATAITVSLMTYGVLPALSRLLSRFLYPEIELKAPKAKSLSK